MEVSDYILSTAPGTLAEIIAAISGLYYLRHHPADQTTRKFVWFLWITVGVEIIGMYAPIAYFSGYTVFGFVKDTVFRNNEWWYNLYIIFSYLFYTYFFYCYVKSLKLKKVLKGFMLFYLVAAPINLLFFPDFFSSFSRFSVLFGTLMNFLAIFVFCYELLQSDRLLSLKTYLPFYVTVGLLVYNLVNTPTDLLLVYFNLETGNEYFVEVRSKLLMFSNLFMYLAYSIGFYICSRANKSY